jgi:hypothetical protein
MKKQVKEYEQLCAKSIGAMSNLRLTYIHILARQGILCFTARWSALAMKRRKLWIFSPPHFASKRPQKNRQKKTEKKSPLFSYCYNSPRNWAVQGITERGIIQD